MGQLGGWDAVHSKAIEVMQRRGWTRKQLYARTVSEATYAKMAEGVGLKRPDKIRALEDGLEWAPGSVQSILDGGEPTEVDPTPPPRDDVATLIAAVKAAVEAAGRRDEATELMTQTTTEAIDRLSELLDEVRANTVKLDRIAAFVEWREAALQRGEGAR